MAQSWCGKHKNKEDKKTEDIQFVCVTCGSKTICKSCLRIPKEWLKQ